uniref:Secreted protein n=1 Tax=Steinernema glaseri TaxID=37863 RepID=A0A1I7ZMC6_9BILA
MSCVSCLLSLRPHSHGWSALSAGPLQAPQLQLIPLVRQANVETCCLVETLTDLRSSTLLIPRLIHTSDSLFCVVLNNASLWRCLNQTSSQIVSLYIILFATPSISY